MFGGVPDDVHPKKRGVKIFDGGDIEKFCIANFTVLNLLLLTSIGNLGNFPVLNLANSYCKF